MERFYVLCIAMKIFLTKKKKIIVPIVIPEIHVLLIYKNTSACTRSTCIMNQSAVSIEIGRH